MTANDTPGREIPKDYRQIADHLVSTQGWTYRTGKGHPMLFPADKAKPPLAVPTTPGDKRSFANWCSEVRRRGGALPK